MPDHSGDLVLGVFANAEEFSGKQRVCDGISSLDSDVARCRAGCRSVRGRTVDRAAEAEPGIVRTTVVVLDFGVRAVVRTKLPQVIALNLGDVVLQGIEVFVV